MPNLNSKNSDIKKIINNLIKTIQLEADEQGHHIQRIKTITKILLEYISKKLDNYNFTDEDIQIISEAAAIHDIGKIDIPKNILNKQGKLTKEEFEIMKTHTLKGCKILEKFNELSENKCYKYCYDICRYHHERWDGNGYPDGISGKQIPIWAQVVSMADVYDALVSKRVYKQAYTHNKAVNMIKNNECGVFNPEIMKCFLEILNNNNIDKQ